MDRVHLPPTSWIVPLLLGLASAEVTAQQPASPATQREFLDRVAALARSAPTPEPVRGDHSIRGRVVTVDGTPVEGVLVRATSTKDLYGGYDHRAFATEWYGEPDFARSLRASASIWLERRSMTRDSTTGADGTFRFDDLDGGSYDVRASRDGFVFENDDDRSHRRTLVTSGSNVELIALPTSRRTFELRLPDGSAPDRATLQFRRLGETNEYEQGTWRPEALTVDLPPGDWIVVAASGGDASRYLSIQNARFLSSETNVLSPPRDGAGNVVIELRGVCAIEGTISAERGGTPYDCSVAIVELDAGEEPVPSLFSGPERRGFRPDRPWAQVQSNNEGRLNYRVERLSPGRWYLGVFQQRQVPPLATAVLDVGQEVVVHDFVLPPADTSRDVRVRVFGPDGAALRDCVFAYWYTSPGRNGEESGGGGGGALSATRNRDGSFTYSLQHPRARMVLFAAHPRFGSCAREVPVDAREVEMRFAAPVPVKVRIPGFTEGSRGRDLQVEWTQFASARGSESTKRIDDRSIGADEVVDVGLLQPGRYRLAVSVEAANPGHGSEKRVACAAWNVDAETRTLELPFPKLAPLHFSVKAGTRGWFTLSSLANADESCALPPQNAEVDGDGAITFEDVVPGHYMLKAPSGVTMMVEAPTRGTIAFVDGGVNVLRVVVHDPAGALAKSGLATGDTVVAVDGREFRGKQQLDGIRQSLKGAEVTLTVQRGEKRFEVVISLKEFVGGDAPGGSFFEASR